MILQISFSWKGRPFIVSGSPHTALRANPVAAVRILDDQLPRDPSFQKGQYMLHVQYRMFFTMHGSTSLKSRQRYPISVSIHLATSCCCRQRRVGNKLILLRFCYGKPREITYRVTDPERSGNGILNVSFLCYRL